MPEIATTPGQVTGAATNATSESNSTTAPAATPPPPDSPGSIFPYIDEEGRTRHDFSSLKAAADARQEPAGEADRAAGLLGLVTTGGSAHNLVVGGDPDDPKDRRSDPDDPEDRPSCPAGYVFLQKCGHGNWGYVWRSCDKWSCEPCWRRRMVRELIPEMHAGLALAKHQGNSLKMLTLTYQGSDLGAQPTHEGQERRRKDLAHFWQTLRRHCPCSGCRGAAECPHFSFMKSAEQHKSGKVHIHLGCVMPWVSQATLRKAWNSHARGDVVSGGLRVDIEAAGMRCPRCWPGRNADRSEKKRSMIYPPPAGNGECRTCGYRPDDERDIAWHVAWELGKYLVKPPEAPEQPEDEGMSLFNLIDETAKGVVGKLSRSKGWREWRDAWLAEHYPKPEAQECEDCSEVHKWTWAGRYEELTMTALADEIVQGRVAVYRQKPCKCFDSKQRDGAKASWVRCPPDAQGYIEGLPIPDD